jgi:hypothetical protein
VRIAQRYALAAVALALVVSATLWAQTDSFTHTKSKVDINYLVHTRRPIWMGPEIRYTVYEKTRVEARFYALTGEMIQVLQVGEQEPGQHTLPWDGTLDEGLVQFEGKYKFELYFGDDYACEFWFICKPIGATDDSS